MATQRLYYTKPEALDVDATVVSVSVSGSDGNASEVILDRTPFYPEGGGQPWDLGTIAGLPVGSVVERDDEPVHVLACSLESLKTSGVVPGNVVRCQVDAWRRRDHSEQHTAQHLLSATVLRILGAPTKSFHLGERYSSIDVDIPLMDRTDADAVEAAVMEVVKERYSVTTHLCPPENPDSFPLRRKPPVDAEILRILEIDGIDYTPCAGTHLRNTGEIHAFRILRTEKYKGMTRIYFIAGSRAQADYVKLAALVREAAAAAGCAEDEVATQMSAAMERIAKLEFELKASLDQLAILELETLLTLLDNKSESAPRSKLADVPGATLSGIELMELGSKSAGLAGFILIVCANRDYAAAARLAKAGALLGRSTIAVSLVDNKIAAAAASAGTNVGLDLGKLLKPLMLARAGKGGGSIFFQAAFAEKQNLEAFIEDLRESSEFSGSHELPENRDLPGNHT